MKTQEAVALRLSQLRDDENRLTLRAGKSGQWISPPRRSTVPSHGGPLESWSGSPLDPQTRGAWLEIGTLLGRVVASESWNVVAMVDQESIALLRPGQSVQVHLWQAGSAPIAGEVVDISMLPAEEIPEMFARSQLIHAQADPSGRFRAASPHYEVRIRLKSADGRWRAGGRADCRIHVAPRSLGRRLHAFWRKTFS